MTGAKIGNWVVGPDVGRGPDGVAYRATDDTGRAAVLKVLTLDATRTPEFLQQFPAEMLFLQRMNHPNVAKFYASGVHAGAAYYASEWVDGTDLGTLLRQPGRTADEPGLNWRDDLVRIAVQAARALKHAHHRSILHRDLKPANVLVTADGTVKLTDFGVAKVLNLPPLAGDADPWGSAGFTAPELLTGKPFTKKSDLYALGCALYAAATGRPPFSASTAAEFLHKHCYTLPDRPSHVAPKLPPELDDIILGLMSKDPARRPPTAAALLEQFDQLRGKLERKGVTVVWPPDPGDTAVTMPALRIAGDSDDAAGDPVPPPLLSRPAVVAPLFLLVAGILVYGLFFGGGPDPESLYASAQPLLASDDPADWDKAWDEYLDPLSRRHPEMFTKEVAEARSRINDRRELRRAVEQASKFKPRSEAEAAYFRGLRLAQAGDVSGAKRTWESAVAAFGAVESEARWTKLAADGLAELAKAPGIGPSPPEARPGLVDAIGRAKKLQAAGDPAAPSAFDALDYLYRDDPKARDLIRQAR